MTALNSNRESNNNSSLEVKKHNILIVEDSEICALALKGSIYELIDAEIFIATSEKELNKQNLNKFDLIFMDLRLPGTGGIQLSKIIRKSSLLKDIPIICYSSSFESHKRECIEAGMDDFLPKPFLPETLKDLLECWLPKKIKVS